MANVIITALYGPNGEHRGFGKITRDVTERFTSAERELRRTEEAVRLANEHIASIVALHESAGKALSPLQRLVERITSQIGKPRTVIALLCSASLWILGNWLAPMVGMKPFDPLPCFWLQGVVGAYAGLVATVVLATQNRQQRQAEQQAYLQLQVNLSSEKKTAKAIDLIEELRRDMPGVRSRDDHLAEAMARAVDPQEMMVGLEQVLHFNKPSK